MASSSRNKSKLEAHSKSCLQFTNTGPQNVAHLIAASNKSPLGGKSSIYNTQAYSHSGRTLQTEGRSGSGSYKLQTL